MYHLYHLKLYEYNIIFNIILLERNVFNVFKFYPNKDIEYIRMYIQCKNVAKYFFFKINFAKS